MIERVVKYSKYIALAMIVLNALLLASTIVYVSLVSTGVIASSVAFLIVALVVLVIDLAVAIGGLVINKKRKF